MADTEQQYNLANQHNACKLYKQKNRLKMTECDCLKPAGQKRLQLILKS
jgi:hypothetical protein